jgi:tetratricopeptide (TPR) repeat protein
VRLAREARQWTQAERLQRARVEWERKIATPALALPPAGLDDTARNAIRELTVSLEQLGNIQREQSKPDCVAAFQEAIPLCQHINDRREEGNVAFNLGHARLTIPALRDLDQAERWYRRSLELTDERDRLWRGKCMNQLGSVAYERFLDARSANQLTDQLLRHLDAALGCYQHALSLLPPNAVDDLAVAHNALGSIYRNAGDFDRALPHFREAVRYLEAASNPYDAAGVRFNVALWPCSTPAAWRTRWNTPGPRCGATRPTATAPRTRCRRRRS